MRDLYKYFYENETKYMEVFNNRINNEVAVKLKLTIKPMDQDEHFRLYYIPTNEMISKLRDIYYYANQLKELELILPEVAKNEFIRQLIIEEIQQTNQLEGVKSTRKEIVESMKKKEGTRKKLRFKSIINYYNSLEKRKHVSIANPEQIREMYEELLSNEISEDNKLDGKLFRKEQVSIYRHAMKEIHRGIMPETAIYESLEDMLEFLNEDKDVPVILKIAIAHFYFGYIHPFYDGNGRFSRMFSSIYLTKELGFIAGMSMSQASYQHQNAYLKAFENTNSFLNRGELNHFIIMFLSIIGETLMQMLQDLKVSQRKLIHAKEKIKNLTHLNEREYNAMYILAQNHLFAFDKGMVAQELAKYLKVSSQTVHSTMKKLNEQKLILKEEGRPIKYFISHDLLEGNL